MITVIIKIILKYFWTESKSHERPSLLKFEENFKPVHNGLWNMDKYVILSMQQLTIHDKKKKNKDHEEY